MRLRPRLMAGVGLLLVCACQGAVGQAKPTATAPGFVLPDVGGSFRYSVSASESMSKGLYSNGGFVSSTNFSGNAAFLTDSKTHPFNLVYSGGYLLGNSGEPSPFYQNMSFFQTVPIKRWQLVLSDSVNYLPQAATTGLSGIPGVGDQTSDPVGPVAGLGILTTYGPRVGNTATGSLSRVLNGRYTVQGSGSYSFLRYLGDTGLSSAQNGIDSSTESGSGSVNYRLDARNDVSLGYGYTQSSFGGTAFSFASQGLTASYNRRWTRRLSTSVSGGPLRVSSSSTATDGTGLSGPALNFSAAASLTYSRRELVSSFNYLRGVGSGSGVIPGAISDSLQYGVHRSFGREWGLSGSVAYARTKSLPNLTSGLFTSEGVTASGQVSRALSRSLSAFASYTIQDQTVRNTALAANAFSGIYQVASFGLTYSPGSFHLGAR